MAEIYITMNNINSKRSKISNLHMGFTLMELLIVIAIMSILVALAVASFSSAQKRGRDSRRRSDLHALQNAIEQYYANNAGSYPGGTYPNIAVLDATYLPGGEPKDPKSVGSYISVTWTTSAYKVCADLEGDGAFTGLNQDTCVASLQ